MGAVYAYRVGGAGGNEPYTASGVSVATGVVTSSAGVGI